MALSTCEKSWKENIQQEIPPLLKVLLSYPLLS